jgi:hypothetical protein
MKTVVLQSNYLPWKGYFDLIKDAEKFIFYDEVKYTKNDWRNRNKICSKNGLQWLSIPIDKDAVKLKISEVKMRDNSWQQLHFDSLYYAYKRAPYFSQLEELMIDIYRKNDWAYLSELNQYSIKSISSYLQIKTKFENSSSFSLKEGRVERLVDLLIQAGTTHYISGPAAKDYLHDHTHLFTSHNIELTFKDYSHYKPYTQLSQPFEEYVSVVDLLANIHKDEISNYIWGFK